MQISCGTKEIKIDSNKEKAIIEFEFDEYILYVFPGKLSYFDILIKYKKANTRIRTPKHIHWVVDVLLKMENVRDKTIKFLKEIKRIWNNSKPLQDRTFDTIKNLINNSLKSINLSSFIELNNYGEYPVDFLCVMMQLLSIQEKTNRADAYMFGQIIDELLEVDLDIFKILSKAGFGGRK